MSSILLNLCVPQVQQWRPKITGCVEDVVSQFSSLDVMHMFRLSWPAVDMLIRVVSDAIKRRQPARAIRKQTVSVEKKS